MVQKGRKLKGPTRSQWKSRDLKETSLNTHEYKSLNKFLSNINTTNSLKKNFELWTKLINTRSQAPEGLDSTWVGDFTTFLQLFLSIIQSKHPGSDTNLLPVPLDLDFGWHTILVRSTKTSSCHSKLQSQHQVLEVVLSPVLDWIIENFDFLFKKLRQQSLKPWINSIPSLSTSSQHEKAHNSTQLLVEKW